MTGFRIGDGRLRGNHKTANVGPTVRLAPVCPPKKGLLFGGGQGIFGHLSSDRRNRLGDSTNQTKHNLDG